MDIELIERLIHTIGKKVFVEHYHNLKNPQLSTVDKIKKLPRKYKIAASIARINAANRIFRNNDQLKALKIIIDSKKITVRIKEVAEKLRDFEISL